MRAGPDPDARGLGVPLVLAQKLRGERMGCGSLAGARWAVEQVRVRGRPRGEGRAEHHPRVWVVLGAFEYVRGLGHTVAARAAPTSASTSAWTSSGARLASTLRKRPGSASSSRSYASRTRS